MNITFRASFPRTAFVGLGVLVLGLCVTTAGAQDANDPDNEKEEEVTLDEATKARIDAMISREEQAREAHMSVLVSNIERTCKLDETQAKRLKLAAKGATKKSLDAYRKQMTEFQLSMLKRRQRLRPAAGVALALPVRAPRAGGQAVAQEPIWVKALDSTLNDTQKAQWEKVQLEREAFERQVMLNSAISIADVQLQFDSGQRKEIFEWMQKNIPTEIPNSNGNVPAYANATRFVVPMMGQFPKEKVEEIFSPAQQTAWKRFVQQYSAKRRGAVNLRAIQAPRALQR